MAGVKEVNISEKKRKREAGVYMAKNMKENIYIAMAYMTAAISISKKAGAISSYHRGKYLEEKEAAKSVIITYHKQRREKAEGGTSLRIRRGGGNNNIIIYHISIFCSSKQHIIWKSSSFARAHRVKAAYREEKRRRAASPPHTSSHLPPLLSSFLPYITIYHPSALCCCCCLSPLSLSSPPLLAPLSPTLSLLFLLMLPASPSLIPHKNQSSCHACQWRKEMRNK